MTKLFASFVAVAVAVGCGTAKAPPPPEGTPRTLEQKPNALNVGIMIFDDMFITEMAGAQDAWHHVPADKVNVFTVAPSMAKITTYESIIIQPDFSIDNAPNIDVIVVPSGNNSRSTDLENTAFINFVKTRGAAAKLVTSHCWGAFVLAKADLLDGKKATTFPGYEQELGERFPKLTAVTTQRWVEDGNVITSNGGLATYEATAYVARKQFGTTVGDTITSGLVFSPDNLKYSTDPVK